MRKSTEKTYWVSFRCPRVEGKSRDVIGLIAAKMIRPSLDLGLRPPAHLQAIDGMAGSGVAAIAPRVAP